MAGNIGSPSPIQPLSVGNVVSAGIRLYRSHLKDYFLVALIASLWLFLPLLFFIGAGLIGFWNVRFNNNAPGIWVVLVVVGIIAYLYGLGKALVNTSVISRLAFGELVNQPETVSIARSQVNPKLWTFVFNALLLFVIFLAIFVMLFIFGAIVLGLFQFALGRTEPNVATILLTIVVYFVILTAIVWFSARFLIADVLIGIENNLDAVTTVGRSWELTQNNAWRIVLILFVALLITFPIQLVFQLITQSVTQPILLQSIQDAISGSVNAVYSIAAVYLVTFVLAYLLNAAFLPFWQSIKAVIYYDLRSRREGLGLKLREREF